MPETPIFSIPIMFQGIGFLHCFTITFDFEYTILSTIACFILRCKLVFSYLFELRIEAYEEGYRVVSFNFQKFLYESVEDHIKSK